MITVRICNSLPDAQVIQSLLEGSGIKSFLPDESSMLPSNTVGGIRVQVLEEDAERATEVLNAAA
jgi:hypothetical protein